MDQRMKKMKRKLEHLLIRKEMTKKVYFAHPYGGNEENKSKVEELILKVNSDEVIAISPIHAFGFTYFKMSYIDGILPCIWLLNKCDEIWVHGDWSTSKGVLIEILMAKILNIPIVYKETYSFEEADTELILKTMSEIDDAFIESLVDVVA